MRPPTVTASPRAERPAAFKAARVPSGDRLTPASAEGRS
jgi:hypothetical protein